MLSIVDFVQILRPFDKPGMTVGAGRGVVVARVPMVSLGPGTLEAPGPF